MLYPINTLSITLIDGIKSDECLKEIIIMFLLVNYFAILLYHIIKSIEHFVKLNWRYKNTQCYYIITLLHYILQYYCMIILLYYYIIILVFYCMLYYYIIILLYYRIIIPLHHCIVIWIYLYILIYAHMYLCVRRSGCALLPPASFRTWWLLATGCWLLVVGCWLLIVCCKQSSCR